MTPTDTNSPPCGKLIVLEGIDGAGTTTQVKKLASLLHCSAVREPAGVLEPSIRDFLDKTTPRTGTPMEMATLFTASMILNKHELERELNEGCHVVSDRHCMSTLVYQGDGLRHRPPHSTTFLHQLAGLSTRPDLTLLLDVDSEVAFRRIAARKNLDVYEGDREMQERLRTAYLLEAQNEYHNCVVIDGTQAPGDVFTAITAELWRAGIHP